MHTHMHILNKEVNKCFKIFLKANKTQNYKRRKQSSGVGWVIVTPWYDWAYCL